MHGHSLRHGGRGAGDWRELHLLWAGARAVYWWLHIDETGLHGRRVWRRRRRREALRALTADGTADLRAVFGAGYHRAVAASGARNDGHRRGRDGCWTARQRRTLLLLLERLHDRRIDVNQRWVLVLRLGRRRNAVLLLRSVRVGVLRRRWGRAEVLLDLLGCERAVVRDRGRVGGGGLWAEDAGELRRVAEDGEVPLLRELRRIHVAVCEDAEKRGEERKSPAVAARRVRIGAGWGRSRGEGAFVGDAMRGLGHTRRTQRAFARRGRAALQSLFWDRHCCFNCSWNYRSDKHNWIFVLSCVLCVSCHFQLLGTPRANWLHPEKSAVTYQAPNDLSPNACLLLCSWMEFNPVGVSPPLRN